MAYCASCGRELPQDAAFCPACGKSVSQTVSTATAQGQPRPQMEFDRLMAQPQLQDLWFRRVLAFVIDSVIVGVAVFIIGAIVSVSTGLASGVFFPFTSGFPSSSFFSFGFPLPGVFPVFVLLYFVILELAYQRTFGKAMLGLRVVTMNGASLDAGKVLLRNISKVYWVLLLLDLVGGLITPVQTGQKYLDHIAKTNVVLAQ